MKKIEMVNKAIHEKLMLNFYTRLVNWYRVTELSEEQYEIKFYINFYIDDVNGIKAFEEDIKEIVKAIEDNALMKIDNKYHILVISDVDIIDESILEITTICEKIQK